ncbi:MAG: hypothetical protein NPIRA04_26410 [Nitrospirales bacterium]|nr:MAG: hypothetical protein NPIRA04_26410 [Nitrospirales bacterium]
MSIKVQFTRNGRRSGNPDSPPIRKDINDVHFEFERGEKEKPKLWYTKDGKTVGKEQVAPDNAADVGIEFGFDKESNVIMLDSHWTDSNGKPIDSKGNLIKRTEGYIGPPEGGANDWHFEVPGGIIKKGHWTINGKIPDPELVNVKIDIPVNVNDVHITAEPKSKEISFNRPILAEPFIGYMLGEFRPDDRNSTLVRSVESLLATLQAPQLLERLYQGEAMHNRIEGLETRFEKVEQLLKEKL